MTRTGASLGEQYAAAAHAVSRVLSGESLATARDAALATVRDPQGRAGAQNFLYTTLRAYGTAPALLAALLERPVADTVLTGLLYIALTDLRANTDHAHTIVDQAVHAAVQLGRTPARGLVNAVLRSYLRRREALEQALDVDLQARWQHPRWWISLARAAYPHDWQDALRAANAPPPLCLRVNRRAGTVAGYAELLAAAGFASRPAGAAGLLVEPAVPVDRLPGFHQGLCSVQDAGAQRAAVLLDATDGQRVLDACAAPGSKAAHVLELADVDLLALDVDVQRLGRIEENLARLRLRARVRAGDAAAPQGWWDGRLFDRIVADVPCSASGVARRHPDVKWLRRKSDVARFARMQQAIVRGLWPLLAPGGKFLYATCSVFPEENEGVVQALVAAFADTLRVNVLDPPRGQLLPAADHDGFFYALLEKKRTG